MKSIYLVSLCILFTILLTSAGIDLVNLFNYSGQSIPTYITKDNTAGNSITDEGATLGRVLFYDKSLSLNNTISCASCHLQSHGFGDSIAQSIGFEGGLTGRHSMRLINARFSNESNFFWDERVPSLEAQTTAPIQDHVEMGFSNTDGNPGIDSLFIKLENIDYYNTLFDLVYGSTVVTEARIQDALAQFIRSIQSFDSPYDVGVSLVNGNINAPFPNFSADENAGKTLYMTPPGGPNGGAGCNRCHQAPEFDIAPNSQNNNVIGVAGTPGGIDLTNTRSPSLRGMFDAEGNQLGPFMHNGALGTLEAVINHYNDIDWNPAINPTLDVRLRGPGGPAVNGQNLNLTQLEKDQLLAFLQTLSGSAIYTDEKFSDPFESNGSLNLDESTEVAEVKVLGRLNVSNVPSVVQNNEVLVVQNDGTISKTNNTVRVSETNDTLFMGSQWIIVPGLSNANQ
ncbi:MAG: cytochrome c peroxidase [Saprospiraceae bacterium]|nr:cytochrome c peroxidase [Saprospiraceae bacterium]